MSRGNGPEPYFKKSHKCWYVDLEGRPHRLSREKEEAWDVWHQLMAKPKEERLPSGSLAKIFDAYLEFVKANWEPATFEGHRYRLNRFCKKYPRLTVRHLRPHHVQTWLDSLKLAPGTKHNHGGSVKAAMKWAKEQGLIDTNPIETLKLPSCGRRELALSPAEFEKLLRYVPDANFRDLLVTAFLTGCRAQEILAVEGRHVDLDRERWFFPASEGKGGRARTIYLPKECMDLMGRLVSIAGEGKLFRNSKGKAWSTEAVNCGFCRIQARMGTEIMLAKGIEPSDAEIRKLMSKLSPYRFTQGVKKAKSERELLLEAGKKLRNRMAACWAPKYCLTTMRHSFCTNALLGGLDTSTVALLMGHADTTQVSRTYQHLEQHGDFLSAKAQLAAEYASSFNVSKLGFLERYGRAS